MRKQRPIKKFCIWARGRWQKIANKLDEKHKFIIIVAGIFVALIYTFFWLLWRSAQPMEASRGLESYFKTHELLSVILFALPGFIGTVIGVIRHSSYSRNERMQKERIRILKKFSPEKEGVELFTAENVYHAVIAMLDRAGSNENSPFRTVRAKVLLCAPAFDYPTRWDLDWRRQYDDYIHNVRNPIREESGVYWGQPFYSLLKKLITQGAEVSIYYMPDKQIFGINPLREFVEVLANYCAKEKDLGYEPEVLYKILYARNKEIDDLFRQMTIDKSSSLDINNNDQSLLLNVPFQIFLYWGKQSQEVVVAFAGKEIIEDENLSGQPQGFQSTDVVVVSAFEKIFNDYVQCHRRTPIRPLHTCNVIDAHEDKAKGSSNGEHSVSNYMSQETSIKGVDIIVHKGVFSPAIANSSKFTSYVMSKIINESMFENSTARILDIGSGTGVQAILAYKILETHYPHLNKEVHAIEFCEEAYNNLLCNCKTLRLDIKPHKWELVARLRSINYPTDLRIEKIGLDDIEEKQLERIVGAEICEAGATGVYEEAPLNKLGPFDLVIADLPYVDTIPSKSKPFERAFFDTHHLSHRLLFKYCADSAKCRWVGDHTLILTSFSTLGGIEDVAAFERLIVQENLHIIQSFSFFENGYSWMVYGLIRPHADNEESIESHMNNYWWRKLGLNEGLVLERGCKRDSNLTHKDDNLL